MIKIWTVHILSIINNISPRGMVRGGRTEEGSEWGTRVCLWQIHIDVWQNQYNIVKLKKKYFSTILLCYYSTIINVLISLNTYSITS